MHFVDPDLNIPTNYFVYFEASAEERSALLRYLNFLAIEHVYERVMGDKRFAPSLVWKRWASGTFIGFSGDRLMLKSGHRFVDSHEVIDYLPVRSGRLSIVRCMRKCVAKIRQAAQSRSLDRQLDVFAKSYPRFRKPPQHNFLVDKHGFAYLRMLEVFNLAKLPREPTKVVEIGGGSCVNAALMIGAYGCKYTIIDLPETIPAGFALLKSAFPALRVALPDMVQDHLRSGKDFDALLGDFDVVFLLPFQSDAIGSNQMDCAFNVSSFQEMEIDVVNEYLSLLRRIIRPGGHLLLENLKVSREVLGNSFDRYVLAGFDGETIIAPSYANYVIRGLSGLEHFFYQGRKL
ncbi:MAG: putative sugar O-methyltransferase [Sulfuritalea sp.]|nr:putative sugar O-methyltransferase [Sulfuritalea sp.]